jgi:hypothetical protein
MVMMMMTKKILSLQGCEMEEEEEIQFKELLSFNVEHTHEQPSRNFQRPRSQSSEINAMKEESKFSDEEAG